jgi:hypothetical protein
MNQGDSNGFFMKIVLGAMKMVLGAIFIFHLTVPVGIREIY